MTEQVKGHLYADGKSIGADQLNPHLYERKALIEARKEQYFGQLASVKAMPKNHGKEIRLYHYIPLLDDENINDQGIDASGAKIKNGNLYGSSKDIGSIPSKMPVLGETGGRVNRVGVSRKELKGTFEKFGFFAEYSADLLNFDSDAELLMHINRELLNGAMEITEDALQIDLINNAGTLRYCGPALEDGDMGASPHAAAKYELTYKDLMGLSIDLDNNRTPKKTTIIKGTRLIDTVTLPSARVAYCGSEMIPTLEMMKDLHGNPAWVPTHKYAAGTTLLNGERGQIGEFRFVIVPEMMKFAGAGAAATDADYHETDGKYDVFPVLVVGDESFTTIGFQTDGKTVKFQITHKKPGKETADKTDPYGEMGFISIKWWYGFMVLRGERLALLKSLARM
ncbi:N4-gp56 family major capsid protein [Acinetobacter sp. A47]|uniref:N4-gp56 family major capsid protein n=1 Tax=Acinetobacter sp. A47 TaxID=1561217 RepID=UPI00056E1EA6|nr:N4-gp56 family major capsid protein [Acinetobacter sp. A47]